MAIADTVAAWTSTAAAGFLDIQPAAGVEWLIQSIRTEAQCEIYMTDGTNPKLIQAAGAADTPVWNSALTERVTNSLYLRIKNTHASTKYLGYAGVVTK